MKRTRAVGMARAADVILSEGHIPTLGRRFMGMLRLLLRIYLLTTYQEIVTYADIFLVDMFICVCEILSVAFTYASSKNKCVFKAV